MTLMTLFSKFRMFIYKYLVSLQILLNFKINTEYLGWILKYLCVIETIGVEVKVDLCKEHCLIS